MDPPSWAEWVALLFFLALASFATVAETALKAVSRARLQRLREQGVGRAQLVESLLERPGVLVPTVHLVNLIAIIGATTLITGLAWRFYPGDFSRLAGALISFVVLLALCQIGPRAAATQDPERAALWLVGPLGALESLFGPLIRAINLATSFVLAALGAKRKPALPLVTEEELRLWVSVGEEEGVIEEGEREMIHGIFRLEETVAREIMVPRLDIVAVEAEATVAQAVDLVLAKGKSRLPVYEESLDNILGLVQARDLFRYLREGQAEASVRQVMRPAYFIPDSKRIDELLREMQQQKVHMTIVVDEYGGTAGLLTVEDLLEEIVGEIQEEGEEPKIRPLSENEAIFEATVSIADVNETLGTKFEAEEYDTIGGLVYHHLGKVPTPGDEFVLEGATVSVLETTGRRIRKVKVCKGPPGEEKGEEAPT